MTTYSVQQLLQEYKFQRQQGVPPNSALQFLARLDPGLSEETRRELAQWIRKWELERGNQDEATVVPETTPPKPNGTPPKPMPPVTDPEPEMDLITCKRCGAQNPGDGKYCYSCGELLEAPSERAITEQLEFNEPDPAMFGNLSTLLIAVRGHEQNPLHIHVGEQPLIIGRSDDSGVSGADIDLAPFGAKNHGVSRSHAVLKRQDNTITLTDQGSVNHTYINGERIHPHEVRVVRDGDEIRFGKLSTRVTFYRELRRLN